MRKRIVCLLLAALLAALPALSAAAASVTDVSEAVVPPKINDCAERDAGTDREITLSYTAGTELLAPEEPWEFREAVVFCEVSADGKNWYTVKTLTERSGTFTLSLMQEILPALADGGAEMLRLVYGFDCRLHLVTAADYVSPDGARRLLAISGPSGEAAFRCPEFTYVDCEIPADASLDLGYPAFMYYPNKTELPLAYPTRPGYFFAGWLKWGEGGYTESVPAHSRYYRVIAQRDPRTYAVNYVLSTVDDPRFSYAFGRADNSKNPTTHTVGESTTVQKIKSPVGGYDFDGWYLTPDFSGEPVKTIPPETVGDLILYARWITFEERDARTAARHEQEARSLEIRYCDLDDDGDITPGDARLALRLAVGLERAPTKEMMARADIYDTGIVTPATARTILRISVGLDSLYEVLRSVGLIAPDSLDG